MHILLLHPPQAKPAEPPAGIPLLAAALRAHDVSCTCCDLNIEGLSFLLDTAVNADDTWSHRATKNRFHHLAALTGPPGYHRRSQYRRAVTDLNRYLDNCGRQNGIQLSLANYQDPGLSPLQSEDLLASADQYRHNIFYPFFARRLRQLIARTSASHVGLSLNYLSQALCTFAIAGFLKEEFPHLTLILGGGLVTTWLHNPSWQRPFAGLIDHLVSGPGEDRLLELLTANPPGRRVAPDYSDFRDYRYLAPGFILPYAASTGCFWRNCSFCPETSEGNSYRPVPPQTAITEIEALIRQNRPSLLHLLDNAVSPALLARLVHRPLPVPWYGFVRFSAELADPAFCRQLRRAGCVMLKLGLESGSQTVLDQMGKGIELQLVARVLAALRQAGIATYIYLLFGTPAETLSEARLTLDFVRSHHNEIDFLNLAIFNLPVGSPETARLVTRDFYLGDLAIYRDFHHPKGWHRQEIRRFLDHEFKREPAIHEILLNDPPLFTSNHAPFFVAGYSPAPTA
ncbi:MAG: B12-binding domain-containing radical SAM protein [Desulfopila sp.]